jgi:release factor glutamine methyltransferase
MKISEVLKNGIYVLKERNIDESNLKARILLAFCLGKPKEYLITHDDEEVDLDFQVKYYGMLDRIIMGEPIQYITQKQEFMGLDFYVDRNVLIPQPDTEILVQVAFKYIEHVCGKENSKLFERLDCQTLKEPKILDLCTGSGAIGVSLGKNLEYAKVVASDISKEALFVAKKNAIKNKVRNIEFVESDLFENIKDKFDMIVSNPPYIKKDLIQELSLEVQNEPSLALDGGEDGLDFYRKIAKNAKNYLTKNGMLFLEIGYDQKDEVEEILEKNDYKNIMCLQDFAGNDRVIIARF